MKKIDKNVKNKNLSPSAEGTKSFKKISQLLNAKNFSQKTETPFVLIVFVRFLWVKAFMSRAFPTMTSKWFMTFKWFISES